MRVDPVRDGLRLPAGIAALALCVACGFGDATSPPAGWEFSREAAEAPIENTGRAGPVSQPVSTGSEQAQAYYDQGVAFLYAYQWIFALRSFHAALREDPQLAMAELGLAKGWYGAQAYDEARAALARAEALAQDARVTEKERRWIQAARLQLDGASLQGLPRETARDVYLRALDRLIELDPSDSHAWVLRGNAEERAIWGRGQGGSEQALPFYLAALERDPTHPGAHHYLIHTYENLGRLEQAAQHGEKLVGLASGSPHPIHMYAHVLPRLGRWEEARRWLLVSDRLHREAIANDGLHPADDWHFSHNLHVRGLVEIQPGDEAAGAGRLEEAFEIEGRGAYAGYHRAPWIEYLLWKGRFDEALAAAQATEELGGPLERVIGASLAGEAWLGLGKVASAREAHARGVAAAESIGRPERGNLFEFVLPYVSARYSGALEQLLELCDGNAERAAQQILERARGAGRARSIDVWAGARLRLETATELARRCAGPQIADELAAGAAADVEAASPTGSQGG
jgi:tetratricopeptide (TPR) repeat protein